MAPKEKAASGGKRPLVGVTGFEPTTSWSRTKRSTKLSYTPVRSEGVSLLHAAGQEAFAMFSASSAFLRPKILWFPVLISVLAGCGWTSSQPEQGGSRCDAVLRTPKSPIIRSVGDDSESLPDLPCRGGALCLDGNPRFAAFRNVDHSRLLTQSGESFTLPRQSREAVPAKSRIPGLLPHGTAILWFAENKIHLFDWRDRAQASFPIPRLAKDEELTGGIIAAGRWGILVQNTEACGLSRLRWLSQKSADTDSHAIASLPGDTPVAIYGGQLQGHLSRRDKKWFWHRLPAHPPIALDWNQPTPPQVMHTGELLVYGAENLFRVHRGQESPREIRLHPRRRISRVGEHILIRDEQIGIFRVGRDRDVPLSSLRLHSDLAGTKLPAHSRRERIFWAHDEVDEMLLIERIRMPDCRLEDRVHRLRISTEAWETVASGPGFRMHPTRTGTHFRFVEASAKYRFVGEGLAPSP